MLPENLINENKDLQILATYIKEGSTVFEWGIDTNSIMYSLKCKEYTCVYHHPRFISDLEPLPSNIKATLVAPNRPKGNPYEPAKKGEFVSYVNAINGKYDVIIINGRDRLRCAKKSLEHLNENGVVIIQDFWNRSRYSNVLDYYDVIDGFKHFTTVPEETFVVLKPKPKNSKKLLIYSGYASKPFNYNSLKTHALGGSETATIRTAREFKKLGYDVTVSGNVINSVGEDGVRYINRGEVQEFLDRNKLDIVIVSRYLHFLTQYRFLTDQLYLLNHDVCYLPWGMDPQKENNWNIQAAVGDVLFENSINKFQRVICLTNWHKDHYSNLYPFASEKIHVWGNGIEFEMFPPLRQKIKNKFIWASRAVRGLRRMLDMWPDIIERYPDATLDVYSYSAAGEEDVMKRCNELTGVTHHGGVPQSVLLDRIQDAEYWFYPTNFSETYCITALEMQHSKVCCICTNLAALRDTAGDRAVTFDIPRQGYESEEFKQIALDSLFKVMENEELKQSLVEKAYNWSLEQSWMHRAQELDQLFKEEGYKYIVNQTKKWESE